MIIKFRPKERLYKATNDEKKSISTNTILYLNTEKRAIISTTGKELYLLLVWNKTSKKEQNMIYASLDTINEKLNEAPFIKGIDKDKKLIEKIYNDAYVKFTYYANIVKSENKQVYKSIFDESYKIGA